jgi:hypothetical protein
MRGDSLPLTLLVLLLTLPFLDKPVHIDDTFVLRISEQILQHPWDPFGFDIDWFGHLRPVAEATTNPPFISYWLAPFAALSDYDERILHLAMVPFYLLWTWAMFRLAEHYQARSWVLTLALVSCAPFLVSGNLMRDVPAAAMATGGLWLWLTGPGSRLRGNLGGVLLGLAVLAKYSVAVLLGVWVLRSLLRRRWEELHQLWIPSLLVGVWCGFTWWAYGIPHPLYLLLERSSSPGILWQDKFFSGLTVLGSGLYLAPLLLLQSVARRCWVELAAVLAAAVAIGVWGYSFYQQPWDTEFQLWLAAGTVLVAYALVEIGNRSEAPGGSPSEGTTALGERVFWAAWLAAPLAFSTFFVPFQAVRHLMPALPPLLLLLSHRLHDAWRRPWQRLALLLLMTIQAAVTLTVAVADWEYAAVYRDFARQQSLTRQPERTWFVGHWGWMFYAQRAGFRQLHRGETPPPGDLLLWPEKVHIGDVFAGADALQERLGLVERVVYPGMIPIRTMSMEAKAGFYAVIRQRLPYRFHDSTPLEVMRVYRVGDQTPQTGGSDGEDR